MQTSNPKVANFNYNYYEHIYAGFINFIGVLHSIDYQIGLRGEYQTAKGKLLQNALSDTLIKKEGFNLFPTIFIRKKIGDKKIAYFQINYSRRTSRPSSGKLNPFRYQTDNYTLQAGNPRLNDQFSNQIEFSYNFKNKYNISLGYIYTEDLISQIMEYYSNSPKMLITYRNIGQYKNYRLILTVP